MSRALSSATSLETLRKEAKRWLKALRAGDTDARRRLLAALPTAPADPGLRDVQLALAREHGLPGWTALHEALEEFALTQRTLAQRAEVVLRASWQGGDRATAERILARWPEVAAFDIHTAAATGRLEDVRRCLAREPDAVARKGGSLQWEPLLYVAYARLPGGDEDSVAIATLLLDRGADPNARFDDGWGNFFTVLTGVIGQGEGRHLPHPRAHELAELLIARGADPYDSQALYNTSIAGDETGWLDFLWTHSLTRGRQQAWLTASDTSLSGRVRLPTIDYLLGNAVSQGHLRRTTWLLEHGASATVPQSYSLRPLRDEALLAGRAELVELLERHGAPALPPEGHVAFQVAVQQLDAAAARELARLHPEYLQNAEPLLRAANHGRADVVALLLELGMPVDVADADGQRALHAAVASDELEIVKLLVAHGADIDRPTNQYGGPLGSAAFFRRRAIAEYLAPLSRDVNPLTYFGMTERLDALLAVEPELVNAVHVRTGNTPLFTLPQDDEQAVTMAQFLLARGADPQHRNPRGQTADEFLRERGLLDAADLVEERREADGPPAA